MNTLLLRRAAGLSYMPIITELALNWKGLFYSSVVKEGLKWRKIRNSLLI